MVSGFIFIQELMIEWMSSLLALDSIQLISTWPYDKHSYVFRGLDIPGVEAVVNVEMSSQVETCKSPCCYILYGSTLYVR